MEDLYLLNESSIGVEDLPDLVAMDDYSSHSSLVDLNSDLMK